MTTRHNSSIMILLWIAILAAISIPQTESRRRDPVAELARKDDHHVQGRRLSESNDGGGLLTPDSVRGTRSLAGKKNVKVPVATSPDDHLVTDLPLLNKQDFPTQHWAGLLPVNDKKDGYLFYWLFAPDQEALEKSKQEGIVKEDESNVPLLIWLNGGPACSSMDGLWIENGPFRLNPTNGNWDNISIDQYSWNRAPAYTLYIDQPVGTGLAFTTSGNYPDNDQRVNQDFYYFLTEFMKLHATTLGVTPEKHGNDKIIIPTLQRPLYFSGESHAGHYIPSMMNYIRKQNLYLSALKNQNGVYMPLTGAAIGNGWIDPYYQYSAHEVAYGYSLIGKAQERALAKKEENCRTDLDRKEYTSDTCFQLLGMVTKNALGAKNPQTVSQYDARVHEARKRDRDFPPGHKDVEAYLGQTKKIPNANIQQVLKAIHATPSWDSGQRYLECTDPPYYALAHQDGLGVVPDIVELLEHTGESDSDDNDDKIRLLFFNGIHDLICNHVGNENALENLPWNHQNAFVTATRYGWKAPSTDALGGYAKEFENLTFLKVLGAGHMVPMDVPQVALDMMMTFLYNPNEGAFDTYAQTLTMALESRDASCPSCRTCPAQQECPICDDSTPSSNFGNNNNNKCPKHCQQHNNDSSALESTSLFSSPILQGTLAGVAAFGVLAAVVWCCCSSKSGITSSNNNKPTYHKAGQIELSEGGYRDDDDDDDLDLDLDDEDLNDHGFDDEKLH